MSVIIVIVGISLLILVHELGHFLAAKWSGVAVEEFGFGFPPRLVSKTVGETRYSLNWLPFGGFVRMKGEFASGGADSFMQQKPWRRAIILVAGVVMNFIFGWLLFTLILFIGSPMFVVVSKVVPGTPAVTAGLQTGDRLVGFESAKMFTEFIQNHRGQQVSFGVLRPQINGAMKPIQITAVPQERLGVALTDAGLPPQNLFASFGEAFLVSCRVIGVIFISLANIFSAPQSFVGPIGIFNIAVETGKLGIVYVLQLLALISLNLTVLNILPVPALDGGRLLFLLIEKIKGSPITSRREIFWNTAGFIALIVLILLITAADIIRLF